MDAEESSLSNALVEKSGDVRTMTHNPHTYVVTETADGETLLVPSVTTPVSTRDCLILTRLWQVNSLWKKTNERERRQ